MLEIVKDNSKESNYQIFLEELERLKFVPLKESDKIIYEEIAIRKKVGLSKEKVLLKFKMVIY